MVRQPFKPARPALTAWPVDGVLSAPHSCQLERAPATQFPLEWLRPPGVTAATARQLIGCVCMCAPSSWCCRWLDWDREYNAWKGANLPVSVSYQFLAKTQPPSAWSDPYGISYTLGLKFARHFGPTSGKGNVASFEAGNEPCEEALKLSDVTAGHPCPSVRLAAVLSGGGWWVSSRAAPDIEPVCACLCSGSVWLSGCSCRGLLRRLLHHAAARLC